MIVIKSVMRSASKITHIHLLHTDKIQPSTDTVDAKFIPYSGLKTELKALPVSLLGIVLLMY